MQVFFVIFAAPSFLLPLSSWTHIMLFSWYFILVFCASLLRYVFSNDVPCIAGPSRFFSTIHLSQCVPKMHHTCTGYSFLFSASPFTHLFQPDARVNPTFTWSISGPPDRPAKLRHHPLHRRRRPRSPSRRSKSSSRYHPMLLCSRRRS